MEAQPQTEPTIVGSRQAKGSVELDLVVPETLLYFRGHFPDHPVLPGIVQTHWAVTQARRYFKLGQAQPVSLQVKFKRVIGPGQRVRLALTYAAERARLSFEYSDAEGSYSSGVITFGGA